MPDGATLAVLIFADEAQRTHRFVVSAFRFQSLGSDQRIAREEPGVLWASSIPRRTVPGQQTTSKVGVARFGLVQRDGCPGQRVVDLRIAGDDLKPLVSSPR